MRVPTLLSTLAACRVLGVMMSSALLLPSLGSAQIGSNNPTDADLQAQRVVELESGLMVAVPVPGTILRPVQRVPREQFGVVGALPLELSDLDALVYPDATREQRQALLEGLTFFTTLHTASEGAGPVANQHVLPGLSLELERDNPRCRAGRWHPSRLCPEPRVRPRPTSALRRATRPREGGQPITSMPSTIPGGPRPLRSLGTIRPRRTSSIRSTGPARRSSSILPPVSSATDLQISAQQFGGFVQHTRPSIAGLSCPTGSRRSRRT